MLVTTSKRIKSKYGQFDVFIPRDRDSSIEALNDGYKQSEIARYVKVSDSTVTKIKGKF